MNPSPSAPSRSKARLALAALLVASLSACATTGGAEASSKPKNPDPIEGFNRGVYKFNDAIDRNALRPVAVAYHDHTPQWLQTGVGNFFTNLFYPTTIGNQFLQGKFKEGGQDVLRFVVNTTLGWGGIFDVASGAKLPVHDEDSGQTLGRWGVPPGPYLVVPFLGPASLRDAPARIADDFTQPFRWYDAGATRWVSLGVYTVHQRAQLLAVDRSLREAYDPYVFMRNAYLQRRLNLVYDGNPPVAPEDENWAEEALKEDEAGADDTAPPSNDGAATDGGGPPP